MSEGFAVLVAATISACVAVVSLVISKENKVSEFRQQWIDGLRADVSALIGAVASNDIGGHSDESARRLLTTLSEYQCRISLRFKKDDPRPAKLLRSVGLLVHDATSFGRSTFTLRNTEDVRIQTQEILKEEWERVKAGEPRYQLTLRSSKIAGIALAVFLSIALAAWVFLSLIQPGAMWFESLFKG